MPVQTEHSKLLASANGASSSTAKPLELPKNVERLVLDCFAEEQYDAGLIFLNEVLSPSVVLSFDLMQQLTVIALSKPTFREATFDRTLRRRGPPSKRAKHTHEPELPTHIHYNDVESARSLLLQHMHRPQFAQRFIDILPEGNVGKRVQRPSTRPRTSRSRSASDSPPLDHDGPAAQAAEWLFEDSTARDVFDLMRMLQRSGIDDREFIMAPVAEDTGAKRKRTSSAQATETDATPLTLLRKEMKRSNSTLDVLFTERLAPLCEQESALDVPAVWKLLQLMTAAWHAHPRHFTSQLPQPKRPNTPIDQVDTILDIIFAGISVLDRYDPTARVRESPRYKQQVSMDLLSLCASLTHNDTLSASALSSGISRRLYLVPLSGIQALQDTIERNESSSPLRSILGGAIKSYLEREREDGVTAVALARGFLLQQIVTEIQPTSTKGQMKNTTQIQLRQHAESTAQLYAHHRTLSLLTLVKQCDPSFKVDEYTQRISLGKKTTVADLFDDSLSDDSRDRSKSPPAQGVEADAIEIINWFTERGEFWGLEAQRLMACLTEERRGEEEESSDEEQQET